MEPISQARPGFKATVWVAYHLEAKDLIERYVEMVTGELESRGHEVTVCRDLDSAIAAASTADIMVGWRIVPEILANAPRLKWVQFGSAGIDHSLFPELLSSEVILTTLSGIHRTPLSEHILALMLALSRRLDVAMRLQMDKRYDRTLFAGTADELRSRTVGIIGLGKVGQELARLCKCLGMTVIGTKRTREDLEHVDRVFMPDEMDEVLKSSDYLVLVLPLTSETKALIGSRELGLMKPTARLVNVARGQMVDEDALVDALRNEGLAGAALDVFTREPLPSDSPLYDLENVILTPHVAAAHRTYAERAFEIFKANLDAFESGAPMINVFDRDRGY
jgi:D-2-hydroxyacid dehydrogenase (NADP+)